MAPWLKHLPQKCEDRSLGPQNHWSVWWPTWNSSFRRRSQGIPKSWLVKLGILASSGLDWEPLPQRTKWIIVEYDSWHQSWASICMQAHVSAHTQMHSIYTHMKKDGKKTQGKEASSGKWICNLEMQTEAWWTVGNLFGRWMEDLQTLVK